MVSRNETYICAFCLNYIFVLFKHFNLYEISFRRRTVDFDCNRRSRRIGRG